MDHVKTWKKVAFFALLTTFSLMASAGAQVLDFIESEMDGVSGVDGLAGPRFTAVSPDGKFLYVAGENDNAIAIFERDRCTGELEFVEAQVGTGGDGLGKVNSIAISRDGKHLYTAGTQDSAVGVFARDKNTGSLSFIESQLDPLLIGVIYVIVSRDGDNVYATSIFSDSVITFARASDGTLTLIDSEIDGVGGVNSLDGAFGLAASRDGKHVYAAAINDSAVNVFARDPADGSLDFVEAQIGAPGSGAGPRTVTVTRDGKHVYTANLADSAVAAFARDKNTGQLTFIEAELNGVDGVFGIGATASAFLDKQGRYVFATGFASSGVATFDRDKKTGELTFVGAEIDAVNGVSGLAGVLFADTSGDGKNLYAAGFLANSVAAFGIDDGDSDSDSDSDSDCDDSDSDSDSDSD